MAVLISALASQSQYWAHIQPIWDALPDHLKGEVLTGPAPRGKLSEWVIVAGGPDSRRARSSKVIWVEHGAGQSYGGSRQTARHSAYVGGIGHDHVRLFLTPREEVSARWRAFYPRARTAAIGSAKLDQMMAARVEPDPKTIAFAWHFDLRLLPETRWALPHYNRSLPADIAELRDAGYEVIGHGHPRAEEPLRKRYAVLNVEWVPSLPEVLQRASTLILDTSSAGYEAAALGLSTVWLNCPSYRRNVNHGLRWWDMLPGPSVDEPVDLVATTLDAMSPRWNDQRKLVTRRTYAYTDGSSTQRAVNAILDTVQA